MITNIYEENEEHKEYERSIFEIFNSIDKDGDGFIGVNELIDYLNSNLKSIRA